MNLPTRNDDVCFSRYAYCHILLYKVLDHILVTRIQFKVSFEDLRRQFSIDATFVFFHLKSTSFSFFFFLRSNSTEWKITIHFKVNFEKEGNYSTREQKHSKSLLCH